MRKKTGISFIFDSRHSPIKLLRKALKIVFEKGTKRDKKNSIPSCPLAGSCHILHARGHFVRLQALPEQTNEME